MPAQERNKKDGISLGTDPRSTKILTKSIYRNLREAGMDERDVVAIATELLARAASDLRG